MDSLWPKTKWDLDTTPGSLGSFFCHTFDPEFLFWVLLPLAVLSFSGDILSEATHAIGSGDSSVRIWQGEWRIAVPGELSRFQTGMHSCHCLAQRVAWVWEPIPALSLNICVILNNSSPQASWGIQTKWFLGCGPVLAFYIVANLWPALWLWCHLQSINQMSTSVLKARWNSSTHFSSNSC